MKKELYQKIKKELLKDSNIFEVNVNSSKGLILIKPVQNKSFFTTDAPIENFENENGNYTICGTEFKFKKCNFYNTQIYDLQIKEL